MGTTTAFDPLVIKFITPLPRLKCFGEMAVNLEIGLVTPPVGLNLYVVKSIAPDIPMTKVLPGAAPFVLIGCLLIVLLYIWPQLAVCLPNKMIG